MKKFYAAILAITLFSAGYHLNAQNTNDKALLELVKKNATQLHLSPADADNVMISHSFTDSKTNIQYVYLQQAYQNIKVYNSIMTVIFRDNEVLYSSGKFVDSLEEKAGLSLASPAVQAEQAISDAALHLKLPLPSGLRSIENKFATEKKMIFSPAGIAKQNIETELLWVASDDGSSVKLAWNVIIEEARSSDWWNVRIDAITGAFLEKNNWTVHEKRAMESDELPGSFNNKNEVLTRVETDGPGQLTLAGTANKTFFTPYLPPTVTSADYYISQQPTESPRHNPMLLAHNPWLRAGAGNPAITNGWHFDGTTNYNITRGNNVHAYLDIANTGNPASPGNDPATSTTPDPALTFNFVPNFTQQPALTLNRQAAITNLFYWNNTIHDILYQYGFDEKSGNFQTDNLGRGGLGNDYVRAEAQDASGTDNANFGTPADGSRPTMQMFLWSGVPTFTVNTPAAVAGNYFATESGFSANNKLINTGPKTGQVVYYNDDGTAAGTHFACNGTTPGSLTGKIAMIIRGGGCAGGFVEKVKSAQTNGAIAVIMVNNVAGFPVTMGGTDNTITIPAVMISQSDGALLAAQLANNVNVTLTAGIGIDGDFDNGVVTHEYGHGVSNRLTGGAPNSGCLNNAEQGGEGWSDYIALMLTTNWATANLTDGPLARPMGVYAVGQPLNGTGIRTYPYSTDMTINPHTYTNVANPALAGEVHYIGEIWCATIWDMTWNIIQQEGTINPNIYDAAVGGGNSIALKLVMEGMRLQTCRPGFLDARDGILAADSVLYNGRHRCAIWAAFARRGMGLSAVQGSSNSTTDGIAAFDVPSLVQLNKLATPLTVVQGEQVAINLTATCQCLVNTNYTLRDTIPAGFTYVSSTGGTLTGNVVTFPTLNFSATQETKSYSVVIQPNNAGCAITTNINDNRDGSTTGGFTSVIATGATGWATSTVRSTSPTTSWFAASNNTNRDFSLTSGAAGFTAGSLSVFSFKHFFITKNTIEGGRVEYSINGGTTWLDAGPFIIQQGYNNISSVATPWGVGQKMFGGVSYGRGSGQFINTLVNFSSLSGQNVRVRLRSRGTTTNQGTFEGWYVDDLLQMDGCGGIVKAGLYNGSAVRVDSLASPVFIKPGIPVAITNQPSNSTLCAGGTATFTVVADPATSPTYQWQVSTNGGVSFTDIAGQTTATLTLPVVTFSMNANQYRVVVSSSLSSGFVISNSVTLTVNTTAAITTCPANIIVSSTPGICGAVVSYPVAVVTGIPAPVITYSVASGSLFPVGTTTVTVTATNTCGVATCTFTVRVNDTQAPVITCPANITVSNTTGQCGAIVNFAPAATDNCAVIALTQSTSTAITVGNSVLCNNGFFHTDNSYWRAYQLGSPTSVILDKVIFGIERATGAGGSQPVNVRLYTSAGAFPGAVRTQIASQTFTVPNQTNTLFTATLTTPVTVAGNAIVVVEVNTPDGTVTGNLLIMGSNAAAETAPCYLSATACGALTPTTTTAIGFPNTHFIINLSGLLPVSIVSVPASGSFFPVGTATTVTSTATDAAGNTAQCTFTVKVNDTQAPTFTCPANVTTPTAIGSCTAVVNYTAPATDNCPGVTVVRTTGPASGSAFPLGVTTVTHVATDAAGNTTTCTFTVTVTDVQLPVIGTQPANRTVCAGVIPTFSVTATNTTSYQWQLWNGTTWNNIAGATSATLTLPAATSAMNDNSYRVIATGLCSSVTSGFATLFVNPLPSVLLAASSSPVLLPTQTTGLVATVSPTGGTIAWFKNGAPYTGSTTNLGVADVGTYRFVYTDLNGCVNTSGDVVVSAQVSDKFYVFPNPNVGAFSIRFYNSSNQPVTVSVYNSVGAKVYTRSVVTTALAYSKIDIDLGAGVSGGIYLVELHGSDGKLIGAKRIIVGHR